MDRLLGQNARKQDFSRQHISFVYTATRSIGQKIDEFATKTTPRMNYITQILLRLPLGFAIHYWFLLGPYIDISMFETPMMAVRIFVAYSMTRSWIFNTETLLLFYTSVFYELFIALMEETIYWMFQNEANSVCHESRVVTFGDIDDFWWTPALIAVVIESLYFWSHVYTYYKFQAAFERDKCRLVFVAFLAPPVYSMFGILPNCMSNVWYCINKARLVFVLMHAINDMESADKAVDAQKLKSEVEKCTFLKGDEKTKSIRRIQHLQNRVKMDRNEFHVIKNFTSNRGARDVLLIFSIFYFGLALIIEKFWYKMDIADIDSMYCIIKFLYNWSTSLVTVMVFISLFGFIATTITSLGVWFTTWEINIGTLINLSTGKTAQYTLITLLLESGIPTTNVGLDVESLSVVAFLTLYNILLQTFGLAERQILKIGNRGASLSVWFYFRVLIVFFLVVIAPVMMSFRVAKRLTEDPWSLFFSSGGLIFLSDFSFLLIEWLLVSLTWYTDRYLTKLESCIQFMQLVKPLSYVLLLPFQFYYRYYIRSFRAWWVSRAGNLIFNYCFLLIVILSQQKAMYDKRKQLLNILNSLSDVSYKTEQTDHDCSICFSTIVDGKALPCMHTFHAECLRRWFQVRTVCPTCNSEIQ